MRKYRMLGPGGLPPSGPPVSVYVAALSGDPTDYRILWPEIGDLRLARLLNWGRIQIRSFRDPGAGAENNVRSIIKDRVARCLNASRKRGVSLLTGGVVLLLLGLASFFLPDPLVAVDEALLTVGGAVLILLGFRARSWAAAFTPPRETQARWSEDALLTAAFSALQAKEKAGQPGDSIEDQTRWLIDHVDVPELIHRGAATHQEVSETLDVLEEFIPFKRIMALEKRTDPRASRSRRVLRTRLGFLHGLPPDAITVYTELYKSAQGIPD